MRGWMRWGKFVDEVRRAWVVWLAIPAAAIGVVLAWCVHREGGAARERAETAAVAAELRGEDASHFQLHDAGRVREGAAVRHVFSFRNPTRGRLRVATKERVRKSCGCTSASLADPELLPGQATALAVEVDTQGKRGLLQELVHVDWVDEEGTMLEAGFCLRAVVDTVVAWMPAEVIVSREELAGGELLEALAESDLPVDWTRAVVSSDCDYLKIREQSVTDDSRLRIRFICLAEGTGEARTGRLRLEVPLLGQATAGDASVDPTWVTGELPVHSQDLAQLRASPRRLVLRQADKDGHEWRGLVVVTGDRIAAGGRVVGVASTWGPANAAMERIGSTAVRCDVRVSMEVDAIGGNDDGAGLVFQDGVFPDRASVGEKPPLPREGMVTLRLDQGEELSLPAVLQAGASKNP